MTDLPGWVQVTSPAPRATWQDLAAAEPGTLITQLPDWLDCVCAIGHFEDASRLYAFGTGRHVVVPLVRPRGWPARLLAEECWPHGGIGGALTSGGPPELAEARAVLTDLARRPAVRTYLRFGPHAAPVWEAAAPPALAVRHRTTYVLDLDPHGGFGAVWDHAFHRRARRGVHRAQRSPIEVEADRTGRLVPAFEQLHEAAIPRWARQQHEPLPLARARHRHAEPPRALQAVARRFGAACTIWLASVHGEPAAAIVVLRRGAHAKYWRGAMNRDLAHPVRANHLLQSLAIEDACASGCRMYDMGDSRPGSPLATYKESFGAQPVDTLACTRERLPVTPAADALRAAAKRVLRFRDA